MIRISFGNNSNFDNVDILFIVESKEEENDDKMCLVIYRMNTHVIVFTFICKNKVIFPWLINEVKMKFHNQNEYRNSQWAASLNILAYFVMGCIYNTTTLEDSDDVLLDNSESLDSGENSIA